MSTPPRSGLRRCPGLRGGLPVRPGSRIHGERASRGHPLCPTFQEPGRAEHVQGTRRELTLGAGRAPSPPEDACDVPAPGRAGDPPGTSRGPAPGPRAAAAGGTRPRHAPHRCPPGALTLGSGRLARPGPHPPPPRWPPSSACCPFSAGGSGVRACGARPGPAAAEAAGRWTALPGSRRPPCPVPCAAVAPGDLSSGQWPVWVRGGPLRHLLYPAPSRLQPQPLPPPPGPPRKVLGGGPRARGLEETPAPAGTGTAGGGREPSWTLRLEKRLPGGRLLRLLAPAPSPDSASSSACGEGWTQDEPVSGRAG